MTDVTFYPSGEVLRTLGWDDAATPPPYAKDILLSFDDSPKLQRGIVCRCYAGQSHAVTARDSDRIAANLPTQYPKIPRPTPLTKPPAHLDFWPADIGVDEDRRRQNTESIDRIWQVVPPGPTSSQGLIVVAGETGSRKTTYAREIARRYVSGMMGAKDPPHVVTYEDPIESWFAESSQQASDAGFAYTPRQKDKDVRNLADAVNDALRQKPALLYVNEVRSQSDWRALLFFAGTGHLAITTTHAGTLVETFGRVFRAMRATSAATRSEIANRIVAIVHVKKLKAELIPAVWVQTPRSRMALTQEGLGSLLPSAEGGCYGRAYFAEHLKNIQREIFYAAVEADLAGE